MALAAALVLAALPGAVDAQRRPGCGSHTSVRVGETTEAVAQRCGVNVEALKARNPGLDPTRPPLGAIVAAPSRALPSAKVPAVGNPAFAMPRGRR